MPLQFHQPADEPLELAEPMVHPREEERPWYVCVTKPRQEVYVIRKLREQGYDVFPPMLSY